MTVKELAKKLEQYVKESPELEVCCETEDGSVIPLAETSTVLAGLPVVFIAGALAKACESV